MQVISLSRLIESTIGMLAGEIIDEDERHAAVGYDEIDILHKLDRLQNAIRVATVEAKSDPSFVKNLKIIVKSLPFKATSGFMVYLFRKQPSVFDDLSGDRLIANRIKHVKQVAMIAKLFSHENITLLDRGLVDARRHLFNIISKEGERDE